ncbi:hypothetical protein AGIG_G7822 [Arapaima gigas]
MTCIDITRKEVYVYSYGSELLVRIPQAAAYSEMLAEHLKSTSCDALQICPKGGGRPSDSGPQPVHSGSVCRGAEARSPSSPLVSERHLVAERQPLQPLWSGRLWCRIHPRITGARLSTLKNRSKVLMRLQSQELKLSPQ